MVAPPPGWWADLEERDFVTLARALDDVRLAVES
jgi:hypothetical protein